MKFKIMCVVIGFAVIYVVFMGLVIYKGVQKNDVALADNDVAIEYLVSGSYDNIGCLSIYIDINEEGSEFSFDGGKSWQKSNYGAVYQNGKTTLLVRNKNKEIIYQKEANVTSIVDNAPVLKIDFDKHVNGISDKDLLKGVTATNNGKDAISSVKVDILDKVEDEVLASYFIDSGGRRCYLVRNAFVDEPEVTPTPVVTKTPTPVVTPIPFTGKWTWPTNKPYSISQGFKENKHNGIDIYGPKQGTPIYAARDGEVVDITHNSSSGYYVTIKHDDGYYTRYAHMRNTNGNNKLGLKGSATKYIKVGQRVTAGQQIGELGSSGRSTGPHCHFEIWNGKPFKSKAFNPLNFYK